VQDKSKLSDLDYVKSIINQINSDKTITRGRISGTIREFDKSIRALNNKELIQVSDYLSNLIEQNNSSEHLESLLDSILENITGTK
jgi:hypothetical protein